MKYLLASCLVMITSASPWAVAQTAAPAVKEVRLYALDCGHVTLGDMAFFSDTGEYDGKAGAIADPCFLIRHPKGTLVWDTGLGDKLAANPQGADPRPGVHITVPITLVQQLKVLGLTPAEITYVAFSHFHFDHTGNANLFGASTWIINKAELAAAVGPNPPYAVDASLISAYKTAKTREIDGDLDVFGDGSVTVLRAPGHTPGHQVLEVKLAKTGVVVLSGDLYHQRRSREERLVPVFNVERADTLASMDRIERIVKNTHARVVVQHDADDFAALPKFPAYLN